MSVPGWSGAGYIITDPVTGDGAYKISGGGNGGFMKFLDFLLFDVAGYLGFFDGYFDRILKIFGQDPWHSETLIEVKS